MHLIARIHYTLWSAPICRLLLLGYCRLNTLMLNSHLNETVEFRRIRRCEMSRRQSAGILKSLNNKTVTSGRSDGGELAA